MLRFANQLADGLRSEKVNAEIFYPPVFAGRIHVSNHGIGKWLGYIDKYILSPFSIKRKIRSIRGTVVVHICDHSNAHYTRVLSGIPNVITCHDLLAVRSALGEFRHNHVSWTGQQQQAIITRGLKRAQHIACVSQATADDVERIVEVPLEILSHIPNSLDGAFIDTALTPSTIESIDTLSDIISIPKDSTYIMHIGGDSWYKNRQTVLRLFSSLAQDYPNLQLIVVGPEFAADDLQHGNCEDLKSRIHHVHGVSDEGLRRLYRAAKLLLFPSHIEGFGWPILEAQACGCPVITLNKPPMNQLNAIEELSIDYTEGEIISDTPCRLYVDGSESETIENKKARMRAFAATFTNQASARSYIALYEQLIEGTAQT